MQLTCVTISLLVIVSAIAAEKDADYLSPMLKPLVKTIKASILKYITSDIGGINHNVKDKTKEIKDKSPKVSHIKKLLAETEPISEDIKEAGDKKSTKVAAIKDVQKVTENKKKDKKKADDKSSLTHPHYDQNKIALAMEKKIIKSLQDDVADKEKRDEPSKFQHNLDLLVVEAENELLQNAHKLLEGTDDEILDTLEIGKKVKKDIPWGRRRRVAVK